MNRIILVGRLTKNLELKKANNNSVVNFTIAVNRTFTNANGEREADFINCVAWNKTAENLVSFTGKGSQIAVDGRIQTRSYEDENSKKVYITEVVAENIEFLGSNKATGERNTNRQTNTSQSQNNAQNAFNESENEFLDELDLPF